MWRYWRGCVRNNQATHTCKNWIFFGGGMLAMVSHDCLFMPDSKKRTWMPCFADSKRRQEFNLQQPLLQQPTSTHFRGAHLSSILASDWGSSGPIPESGFVTVRVLECMLQIKMADFQSNFGHGALKSCLVEMSIQFPAVLISCIPINLSSFVWKSINISCLFRLQPPPSSFLIPGIPKRLPWHHFLLGSV